MLRDLLGFPAMPGLCELCRRTSLEALCPACVSRHAPLRPRCRRCGLPTGMAIDVCGECQRDPPPFDATVVAVDYRFPWDHLITAMKFQGQPALCEALAPLMVRAWQRAVASGLHGGADWIVPVPSSARRLRERGFNQAWELTRRLAAPLRIRARADLLHRVVDQPQQVALGRADRLANLRSAFVAPPQASLRGHQVLLVDDVMTTGSTARAAAAALLRGGVAGVALLVLARTDAPQAADPGP